MSETVLPMDVENGEAIQQQFDECLKTIQQRQLTDGHRSAIIGSLGALQRQVEELGVSRVIALLKGPVSETPEGSLSIPGLYLFDTLHDVSPETQLAMERSLQEVISAEMGDQVDVRSAARFIQGIPFRMSRLAYHPEAERNAEYMHVFSPQVDELDQGADTQLINGLRRQVVASAAASGFADSVWNTGTEVMRRHYQAPDLAYPSIQEMQQIFV